VRPRVVLCGSFHRQPEVLRRLFHELETTGCRVLSPLTLDFTNPTAVFVTTANDAELSPADIERFHLRAIRDADFVLLHAPDGYVGLSAAYELGFASALGKPAFTFHTPTDDTLAARVQTASSVFQILDRLQLAVF
jgi:nucleoside 2-deoxyribosyltransferase